MARAETSVFFESPHRLEKTLETLARLAPERLACVARELTKQFEEFRRGTAAELLAHYRAHPPRARSLWSSPDGRVGGESPGGGERAGASLAEQVLAGNGVSEGGGEDGFLGLIQMDTFGAGESGERGKVGVVKAGKADLLAEHVPVNRIGEAGGLDVADRGRGDHAEEEDAATAPTNFLGVVVDLGDAGVEGGGGERRALNRVAVAVVLTQEGEFGGVSCAKSRRPWRSASKWK